MTSLNPQFMIAPAPQCIFIDRATGEPLANGYVSFFSDNSRTTPKPIYTLTGTPGSYTYVPLVNPVPLTAIGTLSDGFGNDIIPYYLPFDSNGNTDLYFLQVYNSGNVFQFSRQAWPNFISSGATTEELLNYIPNGQFLLHNNLPVDTLNGFSAGQIRQALTTVAPGGWQFSRPSSSGAIDIVTFDLIGSFVINPTSSPRYVFTLNTTSPGSGDTFKYLQVVFGDVNKFASNTQEFTFSFTGQSNGAGSINVSVLLIKNYGTGGSATVTKNIGTISVGTSYTLYQIQGYTWGDNVGKTIGPNNDDYCAIAFSFLTNTSQNLSITDVIQTDGNVTINTFPITTNEKFIGDSQITPVPAHDGSTLGLPVVQTLYGLDVDTSVVGHVVASINTTESYSFLCNGTQYLTAAYQSNGIPNSRLQKKLFNSVSFRPIFGTGLNFVTALGMISTQNMIMHTNFPGVVTATADGSTATGFTFSAYSTGAVSYGVVSAWWSPSTGNGNFIVWNSAFGAVTAAGNGTSGFTNTVIRTGSTLLAQITNFSTIAATTLASKYFTFVTPSTSFYVWFKVNGSGTDPAPGGTGILISLLSTDTADIVANKISNGINGYQGSLVQTVAGSSITAGSFFTFNAFGGSTTGYYCWYIVNGVGTDPTPTGLFGIPVNILSTDSAATVENKTVIAINSTYYAVPDLRGQYIVGNDPTQIYDYNQRFSLFNDNLPIGVGSYEIDAILSHIHQFTQETFSATAPAGGSAGVANGTISSPTSATGTSQNNPYNVAFNYFIHY